MQLNDVLEFVATLSREQAHQVGDAVRARFKAIREADPYVYVIERVHNAAGVPHVSYSTWSQGQVCFYAYSIKDFGGIVRGPENAKDGGTGLAVFHSRQVAKEYLDHVSSRTKNYGGRTYRIREIEKATGKLCDFEEQLVKATENLQ
jgi:hypothetical protein